MNNIIGASADICACSAAFASEVEREFLFELLLLDIGLIAELGL